MTFEVLSPREVCHIFSRALKKPFNYVQDTHIDIRVPIPTGYREQIQRIELLFGHLKAPYYPGQEFPRPIAGANHPLSIRLTQEARQLWPGYRGMEEYAREVFPLEEEANGLDWMNDMAYVT